MNFTNIDLKGFSVEGVKVEELIDAALVSQKENLFKAFTKDELENQLFLDKSFDVEDLNEEYILEDIHIERTADNSDRIVGFSFKTKEAAREAREAREQAMCAPYDREHMMEGPGGFGNPFKGLIQVALLAKDGNLELIYASDEEDIKVAEGVLDTELGGIVPGVSEPPESIILESDQNRYLCLC